MLRLAFKNIMRRRLRTLLTLCGVAVGIAAFVSLVGFSYSFEEEWLKLYRTAGTDLVVVRGNSLNSAISEEAGPKLRALPGVEAVVPVVVNFVDLTPDLNAVVYGWAEDSYELEPLVILEGRRFRGDAAEIMLGEALAESLNKRVGDTVEIQGSAFSVVAVFRGVSAFETGGALIPLAQSQRLSDLGRNVTAYNVRLRPLAEGEELEARTARIRNEIQTLLPG